MRRFRITIRGGHRDPVIEAEAQRDLRDAQVEALRLRVLQLEQQLALAGILAWYYKGTRPGPTDAPTRVMRRFDHPTEHIPRRGRNADHH